MNTRCQKRIIFDAIKISLPAFSVPQKMQLRHLRIPYLIFFYLTACAAGPQPQEVWTHKTLSGQDAQAQLITDREECVAYATSLAGYPSQMSYASSYLYTQAYLQAKAQQKQLFGACMHQKGWSSKDESSQ